ncbi:slipin family protein [Providencia stuartii]|uniref:slipin family protein n=1 Tax=Providencia TaxID=586 RepID=UPI0018CA40EA|nr:MULTISPECIES: slipin family protein [Providencia]MBQ0457115.1 slipin family protein [Providencia stuartii]MBQ0693201.1 slipin family protein [Providencia stuartii]MDN7224355.1 slipin family protein [Providencia stuartii]MDQ5990673.1 slipin family protein [Providencia stuartii]QPN42505.1 slipin family protein [Providencia sp. 2.29]
MMKKIIVAQGQIALTEKNGNFQHLLLAGEHRINDWFNKLTVSLFTLNHEPIDAKLADHLRQYHPDWVEAHCIDINLSDNEIAFLYLHNNLTEILAPATRRLYWKIAETLRVDIQQTGDIAIPQTLVNRLNSKKWIKGRDISLVVQVPAWHVGVLKVDGEVKTLLQPGNYGYWCIEHQPQVDVIDTRLLAIEVSGQEILTKDKVTLRINLSANWRYRDILLAFSKLSQPVDYLYRELQFALREIIGTRSLDELLENKQLIDELMLEQITQCVAEFGLDVDSIGVKDIILPGDMLTILSQVVEAEKAAQANVIRRREETAATRSLLNTAKVMENNPIALRLKELETLESIAHRIDQISVYGGLDQVLNGLVKIKE